MTKVEAAIFFDIDGVILDWLSGFSQWMEDHHGTKPTGTPSWFDLDKTFPEFADQIPAKIAEFNETTHFSELKAFDGAMDAVEAAVEIASKAPIGVDVIALTSCGDHMDTRQNRLRNLRGFPFHQLIMLPIGCPKLSYLSLYHPKHSILVDDNPKHISEGKSYGMNTFVFDQPYNRNIVDIPRLTGWNSESIETMLYPIARLIKET